MVTHELSPPEVDIVVDIKYYFQTNICKGNVRLE